MLVSFCLGELALYSLYLRLNVEGTLEKVYQGVFVRALAKELI